MAEDPAKRAVLGIRPYDAKAIHMLSSRTGALLWRTLPRDARSPQPVHSMRMRDGKLYGMRPSPGAGAFFFVGLDCATGKDVFPPQEQKGYDGEVSVSLMPSLHGNHAVARVKNRLDFELKAFDLKTGKLAHRIHGEARGDFGEHGSVSATVQNGNLVFLGVNQLKIGVGP